MTQEDVLRALLHANTVDNPSILLLKKYLLCISQGWFRINGLAPDQKYSLSDYLLDDERIIIDFNRMSDTARRKFLHWFLEDHVKDANQALLSGVATNDYRGYTAEVGLSWWGRITNQIFYKKKSYHWQLTPLELALRYQITGLEICKGKHGLLISLNQFLTSSCKSKYRDETDNQEEPLRNTKRVFLTDDMVDKLVSTDIEAQDYDAMINKPHLFSIHVPSNSARVEAMCDYRKTQRLVSVQVWYLRFWNWTKSFFVKKEKTNEFEMEEFKLGGKNYRLLISGDSANIYQRHDNGQILVTETKPALDSMVFCGGGAKIYAHVGAYKAFEEKGIPLAKFAGSSAGAIMAVLCYLGYTSNEILVFFQGFNQDNLLHYNIDRTGISDARAMKAAVDYMIIKKLNEIILKYNIDQSPQGKKFLNEQVLKNGKITFASLKAVKDRYPDCGIKDELIVTATNVKRRETRYFSFKNTPNMEMSEAVKISASLPVVYKPTLLDGEVHNDGGVLNNLPTEVFRDDHSTLLESEYGNCFSLVALQFDNGRERDLIDKLIHRVYRENFILNWIYGLLTGVKDPVSGWERDRLKLMQYSNQVVLIPVDKISSTQFNLDNKTQNNLVNNGYQAALNYINARYCVQENSSHNDEYLYSTFSSINELLFFCCYRNKRDWFEKIVEQVQLKEVDEKEIEVLRENYFSSTSEKPLKFSQEHSSNSFFSYDLIKNPERKEQLRTMQLFEFIYPVLQKLSNIMLKNSHDYRLIKLARHHISLQKPLSCIEYLEKIKGEKHILMDILIDLLKSFSKKNVVQMCDKLQQINNILLNQNSLQDSAFYANWQLLPRQKERIFKVFVNEQWSVAQQLCKSLKENEEPLQLITRNLKEDNEYSEENNPCLTI